MSVAGLYGHSLLQIGQNIDVEKLRLIMSAYPSHGFVIDRLAAKGLFNLVREPTRAEQRLASKLGNTARWPTNTGMILDEIPFEFLSSQSAQDTIAVSHTNETAHGGENEKNGNADRSRTEGTVQAS